MGATGALRHQGDTNMQGRDMRGGLSTKHERRLRNGFTPRHKKHSELGTILRATSIHAYAQNILLRM